MQELCVNCSQNQILLLFLFLMGNIWMVIRLVSLMQLSVSQSWGICPSLVARLGVE